MLKDFARLAVSNLGKRRLRSWLTMMGIFIGITLLVALVSLGQGLQKSVSDEFNKLGVDKIFVQAKSGIAIPGASLGNVMIDKTDVKAVKNTFGVQNAVGYHFSATKFEFKGQVKYPYIMGWVIGNSVWDEFINQWDIAEGRQLRAGDNNKVVLGARYQDIDVFNPPVKLRDKVLINNQEFKVIGFFESVGNSGDDMNIYITQEAYDNLFDVGDEVTQIIAKIEPGKDPAKIADNIEKSLRRHRGLKEGKEDFEVQTTEDFMESFNRILGVVQVFLLSIAAISLAVGGIGITNTMYTAVVERTKEIGIMKSIGARNSSILFIFVLESGLLGLTGGAIGIGLGMGISKLVEIAIHSTGNTIINAYFPWYLIVGALGFSYIVGTVSGLMPAIQASRQKPVDSLRYE